MKTQQTTISEVKLIYRTKVKASERLQVKCSKDAFDIFMENWDLETIEHIEEFKLMLMTRSNKVLGNEHECSQNTGLFYYYCLLHGCFSS